ncbi:hypothetical protein NQ176_g7551 [Zarea fungicola]|uniref:Uncharacterized protein n=1 Tax=Zarea fungicola TaxID=93591 RepID=A0ACC1MYL2_9HYPO|nr:hypothetical protein NQ176_g7551 [Lecanicillium fungicola]
MEHTRDEHELHDNLIPSSWQRDAHEDVGRSSYGQGPQGEEMHIDEGAPLHQVPGYDDDDEEDEDQDITGPGKLPFRSRRYDLVPDDEAYRYNNESLQAAISSDRRDFSSAQPSPYLPPDSEQLLPRSGPKGKLWTPWWLTKISLLMFTAIFTLLLVGTVLVYYFSHLSNGFGAQTEANHYLWRCLPTAVLVLLAIGWRQVDYCAKILMAWSDMSKGLTAPERSVFLDYVTPALPIGFYRAVRNHHWPVVLTSLSYMLLIGTMLFSTGLFLLEDSSVSERRNDIKVMSQFKLAPDADAKNFWNVGPGAAQLYNAVNFQGLHYPAGTSEDAVVADLQIPQNRDTATNTNYSVSVDSLGFDLACEQLPITNATKTSISGKSMLGQYFVTDVSTSDCAIKGIPVAGGPDHYKYNDPNATQNYQAQFQVYPCNTGWDFSRAEAKPDDPSAAKVFDPTADQRVFLSVTDIEISPYDKSLNAPTYMYVNKITAFLCKPSYGMGSATVSRPNAINGAAQVSNQQKGADLKPIDGVTSGGVAMAVHASASSLYLGTGGKDYALSEMVPTFFQFMTMKAKTDTIGAFTDPDMLKNTATSVYKGMAAQTMHLLARQPSEKAVEGTIVYPGQKLVAYLISTIFMSVFLGLSAIMSFALVFIAPRAVVPHRPGSLASMASIMATSPLLRQVVAGAGKSSASGLRQQLNEFRYKTVISSTPSSFRLDAIRQNETEAIRADRKAISKSSWWHPTASHWWFLALTLIIPLAMIGALEGIQRISDKNEGFLSVNNSGATILTTFVPAAVLLVFASMYGKFATMAAVFAPFTALRKGRASAGRTMHFNVLGRSLPVAFFRSVKAWHFAVAILLIGNFVAAFLSIVVSSLYSVVEYDRPEDMTIHRMDNFKLENAKLALQDNHATSMDSLIRYAGLNYSQWTWEGLAFPKFAQNEFPIGQLLGDAPLVAKAGSGRLRQASLSE